MPAPLAIELDSRNAARAPNPPAAAAPARDVVLLVEDDDLIAALLKCVLARMQWRVVTASDAAEGLRLLLQHRAEVALAFVDCSLPDAHGSSLCVRLREVVPALPVLLTSGRAQPGLLELVAADGPAAFLSKPFLPADVARHVEALRAARAA